MATKITMNCSTKITMNCSTCEHKKAEEPGLHCCMFRDAPEGVCHCHTGFRPIPINTLVDQLIDIMKGKA